MTKTTPCPKCKSNRWKTIEKGKRWMCHACQYIRDVGVIE